MITKEKIKAEIDNIKEEHLDILYKIIKALESSTEEDLKHRRTRKAHRIIKKSDWNAFIQETYGSFSKAPIERGNQGELEIREKMK